MKVRRPYAFCCIEGGGRVSGCMCSNPDHGFAIVDVKAMLPGDEPVHTHSGEAIGALVAWARSQQAFPDNAAGGAGRGHIDENHRFRLRDMVAAIDAAPQVEGLTSGEGDARKLLVDMFGRRVGYSSRMAVEAMLAFAAASPKATATASVREECAAACDRIADESVFIGDSEEGRIQHEEGRIRHEGIIAGARNCAAAIRRLTDSGTAATIGGERA